MPHAVTVSGLIDLTRQQLQHPTCSGMLTSGDPDGQALGLSVVTVIEKVALR